LTEYKSSVIVNKTLRKQLELAMYSDTIRAFHAEIKQAMTARRRQHWQEAWFHLERAHILGQQDFILHMHTHWQMLKLAADQINWLEVRGQLLRLILTPVGHLTGRLPLGNPGSSRYSVLESVPVPDDLQALLEKSEQDQR
jgi:hypothetical protein